MFYRVIALCAAFLPVLALYAEEKCNQSPELVVLLMVKDEAEVIEATLETYTTQKIRSGEPDTGEVAYVLFDTGSTDGTEEKAQSFFEKKGIENFAIIKEPFINFAASRNRGLEIAEELYPQSTFILFPDAEWYFLGFDSLLTYCSEHQKDDKQHCKCYNIDLINSGTNFPMARLMRTESHVRFKGRVHEIPQATACAHLPSHIAFNYLPGANGRTKSDQRLLRDVQWLLEDYKEDPYDRRLLFLTGMTFHCLEDWDNTLKYYRKCAEFMGSVNEYTYLAYFRLANVTDYVNCSAGKNNDEYWIEPLQFYLKAYNMRPHRAEPLIKIAYHYQSHKNYSLAYMFAKRACEIPYPINEALFVEKAMYDFERYKILAICAWEVQDYERGEKALQEALKINPEDGELKAYKEKYKQFKGL